MKPISQETIDSLWDELHGEDQKLFEATVTEFTEKQPFLLAYILSRATTDPELTNLQRPDIFLLGTAVYHVFASQENPPSLVDEAVIEAKEQANVDLLDSVSEVEMDEIMSKYGQETLFAEVVQYIAQAQDDIGKARDEHEFSMDLLHFKTMIDCLDQ